VNAGSDKTVSMDQLVTISGLVSDDGLPKPPGATTVKWTQVSAPTGGKVTFANSSALTTRVTFSLAGRYVLRLTANDGALSAYDEVAITVLAE
jgi:hypothetical protein